MMYRFCWHVLDERNGATHAFDHRLVNHPVISRHPKVAECRGEVIDNHLDLLQLFPRDFERLIRFKLRGIVAAPPMAALLIAR